jgi:hypothetical protein
LLSIRVTCQPCSSSIPVPIQVPKRLCQSPTSPQASTSNFLPEAQAETLPTCLSPTQIRSAHARPTASKLSGPTRC